MMKKILKEEELSELQKKFREYFQSMLDKFGAESPADLDEDKRTDFFNAVAMYWEKGKGPKKDPKELSLDVICPSCDKSKKESKDEVMDLDKLVEKIKENKLKEIEGIKEDKEINETPVGQRGRTSRKEAAEYIADHPEIVKEIEKMVKQVGGKEVFKQIVKIVLAVDIDHYDFKANELEHMRMKKISNLMKDYGTFVK